MNDFSINELSCVAASRQIRNGDTVFVGVGKPVIASFLAQLTHAPDITIVFETGIVRTGPCELPRLLDTLATQSGSDKLDGAAYVNGLAAAGRIDVGFLGAGQVDRYGNVNSVAAGPYSSPTLRWPGGGGANDIGTLCQRTVVLLDQNPRRLCERVDFVTVPGQLDGTPGARERAGLTTEGPSVVVTNLAIFDLPAQHLEVASIHPGVTTQELAAATGWDLGELAAIPTTAAPTRQELELLRTVIDPFGIVLK